MSHDKHKLESLRIDRSAAHKAKPKGWIGVVIVVFILAGVGSTFWFRQPKALAVHTMVVQETKSGGGDKTLLNASGYVTARRQATISAKVTGKVVDVLVEEGMKVEADQILAHIDATNVQASMNQAEAELISAQKAMNEQMPNVDRAERDLQRISSLADQQYVSKSDLDRVTTDSKSLSAHLERMKADVAVSESALAVWKQQLEDTIIRAPFAGIVISKDAQPGEMVSPISAGGGFTRTGICTIVDMNSLEIDVDVNESYINRVTPGQPAIATLDAYPDWQIPSKVIAIIPTADRQKATVKVRVGFDKLDPRILPDMSAKVAFQEAVKEPTTEVKSEMMIPKSAIHDQIGQQSVWVDKNGIAELRTITSGATHGDDVAVTAGLSNGEKIILDGPASLTAGTAVTETKP